MTAVAEYRALRDAAANDAGALYDLLGEVLAVLEDEREARG